MTVFDLPKIKGVGPVYRELIAQGMRRESLSLDQVYRLPPEEIKQKLNIPINIARALATLSSSEPLATAEPKTENKQVVFPGVLEALTKDHFSELHQGDAHYPKKLKTILRDKAPETLYVWGNLALFDQPSVGFCGSRDVSVKGLEVTQDVTQQIAALGWVAVSGHARGVDITAHRTALENNAGTIIVLAEGIDGFKVRAELRRHATPDKVLIISEFSPHASWNVGYAMQRNATIIGLSDAMVLVESRDEGGTFNAGKTALKLHHPLFVVKFQDTQKNNAGNDYFLNSGAHQLMKSKTSNRANITALVDKVNDRQLNRDAIETNIPLQMAMPIE